MGDVQRDRSWTSSLEWQTSKLVINFCRRRYYLFLGNIWGNKSMKKLIPLVTLGLAVSFASPAVFSADDAEDSKYIEEVMGKLISSYESKVGAEVRIK